MSPRIPLLLLLACLCLLGLLISYTTIRRSEDNRRRLATRVAGSLRRNPARSTAAKEAMAPMRVSVPLVRRSFTDRLAGLLGAQPARADLYPIKWWLVPVVALLPARLVALLVEFLSGSLGLFVLPVAAWVLCRQFFKFYHHRRITILVQQFPDALAMIVRSVRVGIPVNEALRAVAERAPEPTAGEFSRLADEVAIGSPLDQALRTMAERNNLAEYRFFATALSLQSQTGGGISETLESLADVIRKRVAARARGKALAAEARASALALAVLPLLAMLALWLMNPSYLGVLFVTPLGNQILAAGALLLGSGVAAMKLIIQKSLQ